MTYDPNQKRGGPANAGNWTKYENSNPEDALPAVPPEAILEETAFAPVESGATHGALFTPATQVLPGDLLYAVGDDGGDDLILKGMVRGVSPYLDRDGWVRVSMVAAGFYAARQDEPLSVVRSLTPPQYPGTGYADRLEGISHVNTTAETLAAAAEAEAEDDFMEVIAAHPNSTPDTIERASRHRSFTVRHAALRNPNTSRGTVVRIRRETLESQAESQLQLAQGTNPMSRHHEWAIDQAEQLWAAAEENLTRRG